MRYLFVHQNFPGQYLHIVRHLMRDAANEVVFISEPNANHIPGVRRVAYEVGRTKRHDIHKMVRDLDLAAHRADRVASAARQLRQLGFTPDIIIGHHGWGELLNVVDVWPGVPVLGYFEFYYHTTGHDSDFDPEFPMAADAPPSIRAMNSINHLALALDQHGQTPTRFQRDTYPGWARKRIQLLPEGARLDVCKPDPDAAKAAFAIGDFQVAPGERLITYAARNLEPYRGLHVMMRALPEILGARPDTKVVMLGGDDVSYGPRLADNTWRGHFERELAGRYDASRVLTPGQVPYETYLRMLQRSDVHVYLTYPFVPSWSLREALACGCAVIGADVAPVSEFISDGRNGLLTPALNPRALAKAVLDLLESPDRGLHLRQGARRYAERHLSIEAHIAAFEARIVEIMR